ncbi:hypothetical protein A3B42_04305 [Candidatus Daviesbacteria bacterium RIFCSPLOWO2_01_FULL_38_10]|uniref:Uncharacterized protein n=1 Tax=Candidatus Daviesbacteria bacterium GW2011_GWF2_38_6 TaxID=1618432 RepID=A0A0G0KLX3_9BACT|nr:MAG: hypothetical protein US80_C0004G0027 [Candidatus Daviesbacteria bacterium GW2011_GWA2_38_17]KKQ76500.1 MAG: hypothetical protein US99_C0070G0002 [Candidatus Daviesbacteria bacterium GW2011_GWF2_38_6]OGE26960.1 MAG: hypothetical protein A3D02_01200 [Candidatus Daviesbacteria bacterium RIFCSPHIGHO2_02_FULL_39_41]OGE38764.1 MAG: hypothetical protein A3B42_04305 [Candidatus Daviesbacteria bacterium RIFCSPLOWO2_01_FULL_38_10]OGE44035.1 MAG: hypothetical protein A3E67_01260 [Candidatus Davies
MFVDGLVELRRGLGQNVEKARSGLDQFLLDERGLNRWTLKNIAIGLGKGLIVASSMLAAGYVGVGLGLSISSEILGPFKDIVYSEPSIESGLKMSLSLLTPGVLGIGGMIGAVELTGRLVNWLPRRTSTEEIMQFLAQKRS